MLSCEGLQVLTERVFHPDLQLIKLPMKAGDA